MNPILLSLCSLNAKYLFHRLIRVGLRLAINLPDESILFFYWLIFCDSAFCCDRFAEDTSF